MKNQWGKCLKLATKIIIILLPIIWSFYIVYKYGVNVSYMDELRFMENKNRFLSWDFLWAQHNEHRMLFPKILTYIIGSLTSWNSKAFMYTSQVFLFIIYLLMIRFVLGERKVKDIKWSDTLMIFCLGLGIYNAAQHENLLWGFQTAWFMIVSLGALSYYVFYCYLKTNKNSYLVLSMVLAVIVSFSSMHGMAVWGGYITVILVRIICKEKISLSSVITIGITCVVTTILYFSGWTRWPGHEGYAGKDPNQIASYLLGEIGESVLPSENILCYLIAFVVMILFAIWIIRCLINKEFIANIQFSGPMILGLGAMFFISMGRSNGGTGMFIASRYLTNSMLFLVFFMLTYLKTVCNNKKLHSVSEKPYMEPESIKRKKIESAPVQMMTTGFIYLGGFLMISISVLLLFRNTGMLEALENSRIYRTELKQILVNYEYMDPSDLQKLHPMTENEIDGWKSVFGMMKEEGINAFADDLSDLRYSNGVDLSVLSGLTQNNKDLTVCIDEINGIPIASITVLCKKDAWRTHGWVNITGIEGKECYLKIDKRLYRLNWVERPDVNAYFESPDYYGYEGVFLPEQLEDGLANLSFVVIERDSAQFIEQSLLPQIQIISDYDQVEEGLYRIHSAKDSTLEVAVENGSIENGGNIIMTSDYDNNSTLFEIKKDKDNCYYIVNPNSGLVLDIEGVSADARVNLQQYKYQETSNQLWYFICSENGNYRIISALGTYITIDSNSGNNVYMDLYDAENDLQEWKLEKIISIDEAS